MSLCFSCILTCLKIFRDLNYKKYLKCKKISQFSRKIGDVIFLFLNGTEFLIFLFVLQAFQKELGKRTSSVQALKRSARELMETGRDDTAWVKVQLQELSNRWETVCALSVSKQTRLQQALKQVSRLFLHYKCENMQR